MSMMYLYIYKPGKLLVYICSRIIRIKGKKSLKIPKGQSESVYRRRTDNTMTKRKSTKGQKTINKTCIQNQRSSNTNPTKNGDEIRRCGRVSSSCSTVNENVDIIYCVRRVFCKSVLLINRITFELTKYHEANCFDHY
jgi:hypothetical protein